MNAIRVPIAVFFALMGCSSPGVPAPNGPPVITEIIATPSSVSRDAHAAITARVVDPEGDPLSYAWTVPAGFRIVSGEGTSQIVVTTSSFVSGPVRLAVYDGASTTTAEVVLSTIDGSWGTATLIETDNAGTAYRPQVAMDANGNAIAVWYQSDGVRYNIWANRYAAGTTNQWGTATLIETYATGGAILPQVAMNANGNAIAVWEQSDGTRYNIWANGYTAGTDQWGDPTLIETDIAGSAHVSQVAMDANGNAVAVWEQPDGTRTNIWANRYTAGVNEWGTATPIETDNAGSAYSPEVAMDANGNAVAVWYQSDGTRDNIWANRYTAGSNEWGTATLIETDNAGGAHYPQVTMDANGNAIAVWYQSDGAHEKIWANRYAAGANEWATATLLGTYATESVITPRVAMDANGNAIVAWRLWDGTRYNMWANRFTAGSNEWGTATLIETDDASDAGYLQIAMDANGNAIAVWRQWDGTRNNIWANRYTAGSNEWGTATLIETDDAGDASEPQVAMDANGNAIAIWAQSDGTRDNIFANAFR